MSMHFWGKIRLLGLLSLLTFFTGIVAQTPTAGTAAYGNCPAPTTAGVRNMSSGRFQQHYYNRFPIPGYLVRHRRGRRG